jgi:predicted nucleic acid-binding protein
VLAHPFIIGEIALGSLKNRRRTLGMLADLECAALASVAEVAAMIEWGPLHGTGVGYVDAHLLASVRLTSDAKLWTLDKRLHAIAADWKITADLAIAN